MIAEKHKTFLFFFWFCTGSTDEQEIFDNIKKTNATLLKRLSGRLFFVVNKVDTVKFSTGASIEECRKSVAARVTKAMDMPDFNLKPEQASLLFGLTFGRPS